MVEWVGKSGTLGLERALEYDWKSARKGPDTGAENGLEEAGKGLETQRHHGQQGQQGQHGKHGHQGHQETHFPTGVKEWRNGGVGREKWLERALEYD